MDLSAIGTEYVFAIFAVLLILGIFSSKLSTWVKSPALLMFLAVGVLAGTEGIGQFSFVKWNGIEFADYGDRKSVV